MAHARIAYARRAVGGWGFGRPNMAKLGTGQEERVPRPLRVTQNFTPDDLLEWEDYEFLNARARTAYALETDAVAYDLLRTRRHTASLVNSRPNANWKPTHVPHDAASMSPALSI